jgi:hypothetical protein
MRGAIPPLALNNFNGVVRSCSTGTTLPIGYFADLTVSVVSCPVVPVYHPAVAVKLSLFLVIFFTDIYM